MKGRIARRAMELGGFPVRIFLPEECTSESAPVTQEAWDALAEYKTPPLAKVRLIAAMRKTDPNLAHMIESLAPVYLVKK